MKEVLYVLLGFSLIIGGFILQVEIANLDFSGWNFTGANIYTGLIEWLGAILMGVGAVFMFLMALERKK